MRKGKRPMAATNKTAGAVSSLVLHGGGSALVTWLAGIGLHSGYNVSVPFLGTWASVMAGLIVVGHYAYVASSGFHLSKVDWQAQLKVAEHDGLALVLDRLNKSVPASTATATVKDVGAK